MWRECRAAVSWGFPASASPAAPLVSLSPDACYCVVCAWNFLFASSLQKTFASGTLTVVEWCCEYILNCSFVISILDVHIVIK